MASSPANIACALRNTPRGQLVYDRQPQVRSPHNASFSAIATASSTRENILDVSTSSLPGSLADVSSVLEDVSLELSNLQIRRVAKVIDRLNKSQRIKEEEEEHTEILVTKQDIENEPILTVLDVAKKSSMEPRKKTAKILDDDNEVTVVDVIGQELKRMEAERQLKVEAKIRDRKKRLSLEVQRLHQRSAQELQERRAQLEAAQARIDAKVSEVEQKFISKSDDQLEFEAEQARKRREAQLQAELAKAKSVEAERLRKRDLLQTLDESVAIMDQLLDKLQSGADVIHDVENVLEPLQMKWPDFLDFLANVKNGRLNFTAKELEEQIELFASLTAVFSTVIDNAATRRQEEAESARLQQEQQQQQQQQQVVQEKPAAPAPAPVPVPATTPLPVPSPKKNDHHPGGVSAANGELFQRVVDYKNNFVAQVEAINQDKPLKFACQKAVTTPLNAISDVSASHLKDKLTKLQSLLRGGQVEVNEKTFTAASHPQGIPFAKNLLAKKLVSHGEEVVSSKPKNAFTAAAIVITLWAEHKDFGELFLAYLFEASPFLLPMIPPKLKDMTEAQHLASLGYHVDLESGQVEDQTMFLKRMTGLARMYAAITIARLPEDLAKQGLDHPHGLGNIWRWLSSTMNLKPLNDVTATLIFDILEVTGAFMFEKYGPAFGKLLRVLVQGYFAQIQSVTEEGSGGPVVRLEMFLKKAIETNTIAKPSGLLRADFL